MIARFARFVAWLKMNPVVSLVGIGASVFTCIRAAPPAWTIAMSAAGRPSCITYSPVYHYPNGTFAQLAPGTPAFDEQDRRAGRLSRHPTVETQSIVYWHEHQIPASAASTHLDFDFREARRATDYIYLINLTPRPQSPQVMLVRIPACGGVSQWTYENPEHWADMFQTWR